MLVMHWNSKESEDAERNFSLLEELRNTAVGAAFASAASD